jgi:serine O-acetyltransferase
MASARESDQPVSRPPSATIPDWSRESKQLFAWAPSRSLLASIRTYQRCRGSKSPWCILGKFVAVLRHRFWSVVTGADIPLNSHIAGGLELPHPNGIVIHPASEIGPNCMIFHQATLAVGSDGAPRLGGNVLVGSGAKLLGGIRIGDNAQIGANAVVLDDVPAGATAVGVPARLILRQEARAKMLRED